MLNQTPSFKEERKMKHLPAFIAALIITAILGCAMLAIGANALLNKNTVPVANAPANSTSSSDPSSGSTISIPNEPADPASQPGQLTNPKPSEHPGRTAKPRTDLHRQRWKDPDPLAQACRLIGLHEGTILARMDNEPGPTKIYGAKISMNTIKKTIRIWIATASVLAFLGGWSLLAHAPKPAPLDPSPTMSTSQIQVTPLPTLPPLNLNSTSSQLQPLNVAPLPQPRMFSRLRTSGS
jgi:hypothetical protein